MGSYMVYFCVFSSATNRYIKQICLNSKDRRGVRLVDSETFSIHPVYMIKLIVCLPPLNLLTIDTRWLTFYTFDVYEME